MADIYLQTPTVNHNFEAYSKENILEELKLRWQRNEQLKDLDKEAYEEAKKELALYGALLENYADEFSALYRIRLRAFEGDEDGKKVLCEFKEIPFRTPEVMPEEYDVTAKDRQLELECQFEDGTKFGISTLVRNGDTKQLTGQISLPDETLENLNEDRLKRIIEFCERNGFSVFGLDIPMYGGEIDVDEKIKSLQALLDDYKKTRADEAESHPGPDAPTEEADDDRGFDRKEYNIVYDGSEPEPREENSDKKGEAKKASTKGMSLDDVHKNMIAFIEKDLHKRRHLSYWEHVRTINGRKTYVFSIYDKEDRDNYRNDGKNDPNSKDKKYQYVPTYAYRLYVSEEKNGKITFGYATPGGKKMDDVMAGDLIGEIKKAGITHLNFKNIPNHDKMVWMIACAEKGIVPVGLSFTQAKVQKMLECAKAKLTTEEFAIFQSRLMSQWEENVAKKGQTLSESEREYVETKRNETRRLLEHQTDKLKAAEFNRQFEGFRKAYNARGGLHEIVDRDIRNGGLNRKSGAAESIAAMNTLARTFDIVVGDDNDLNTPLSVRLEYLVSHPTKNSENNVILIRLSEAEKNDLLASVSDKKIRDLTKEDYLLIYKKLFERQRKQAAENIIQLYKDDEASRAHAKDHILIGEEWKLAAAQVVAINDRLVNQIGTEKLELPDKPSSLFYERPEELKYKNVLKKEAEKKAKEEAEKKAKEEGKEASTTATPASTVTPKSSERGDR